MQVCVYTHIYSVYCVKFNDNIFKLTSLSVKNLIFNLKEVVIYISLPT